MGELIPVQPAIRLHAAVSLPIDFILTLSLLYRAAPGSGLDPWLVNARRMLPDQTRYDLDILEGFSGRLLYFLEEPVSRFQPLSPERRDATFVDLITFLADLAPEDYRDMAVRAVQRVRIDHGLEPAQPGVITDAGDDDLSWRRFLEPALTTATPDEVIPLLIEPERLRARTLDLFRTVWQTVYRDEYFRQEATLQAAAGQASGMLYRGFGRVFSDITDARLPSTLAQGLQDVSDITFHPSAHIGSHISYILSPPTGVIFFNARAFMDRQRASRRVAPGSKERPDGSDPANRFVPVTGGEAAPGIAGRWPERDAADTAWRPDRLIASPVPVPAAPGGMGGTGSRTIAPADRLDGDAIVECARAIGDPTRLRILEMLAAGEFYAQEIVAELGIAQSAVSRHLGLLERSGLVSVRPQRGMKYYSVHRETVRRFSATLEVQLAADPD